MGFLNNLVPFSLLFWAQTMIPSGLASILNATTPIFSIIVAHFLLADERMARNKAIGILSGFLGVVVLLGGGVQNGPGIAFSGMLACLAAALSYGFAGVYGRRFKAMNLSATQVAFGQLIATTTMMVPIISLVDRPWALSAPGLPVIASVLALAIVSTALAYVIFFRVLASAGAVNVTLVTLLVPVSAILLGRFILGEDLTLRHYAGIGLIGIGLLAIDGRIAERLRRSSGAGKPGVTK
ncbi:MAG: DMT family transporter [Roseovarius pacificus]|nr:DMT family transporter [Roseovarius pacificus]